MIPNVNPQVYEQPPAQCILLMKYQQGTGAGVSQSVAESNAIAAAAFGVVFTVSPPFFAAYTRRSASGATQVCRVAVGSYQLYGYSATSYLKAYWDEVMYKTDFDGNIISEESRETADYEFTMPSIGGASLPEGFDVGTLNTWIKSGSTPVTQPNPSNPPDGEDNSLAFYIEKLRYSCLSGYTPPDDGSANGFPA